jgi:hypothetical protein
VGAVGVSATPWGAPPTGILAIAALVAVAITDTVPVEKLVT